LIYIPSTDTSFDQNLIFIAKNHVYKHCSDICNDVILMPQVLDVGMMMTMTMTMITPINAQHTIKLLYSSPNKPVFFENSLLQRLGLVRWIMFNSANGAQGDTAFRAEVAYRLFAVLGAEHRKYGATVTDRNELVCGEHCVGIMPSNTIITELHQTLSHTVKLIIINVTQYCLYTHIYN